MSLLSVTLVDGLAIAGGLLGVRQLAGSLLVSSRSASKIRGSSGQMDVLSDLVWGPAGVLSGRHVSDVGLSGRSSPDW